MRTLARHRHATLHPSGLPFILPPINPPSPRGGRNPGALTGDIVAGWRPVVGMRSPFSVGAPMVTRVAGPYPSSSGDAQWSLVSIVPQDRPIVDLDGHPLTMPTGEVVGAGAATGTITHWMDGQLASSCVRDARTELNSAVVSQDGPGIVRAASRMMDACTAMNICWQSHPALRMLWRRYMSGPATRGAEYEPSQNWNDACSVVDQPSNFFLTDPNAKPRTFVGLHPTGVIPANGRGVFNRCGPGNSDGRPGQFIQNVWLGQSLPPTVAPTAHQTTGVGGIGPTRESDFTNASAAAIQNYAAIRAVGYSGNSIGNVVDSACSPRPNPSPGPMAWGDYGFDTSLVFAPLRFATAWGGGYVAWLSACLDALESETPEQAVANSYLFVAYMNAQTLATTGGANAVAMQAAAITAEFASNAAAQQDLSLVRAAAPAISAAVSSVTAAGLVAGGATAAAASAATAGIGALIIGSVTLITLVASALWPTDLSSIRLDDLLRPRPWFDRNALAGSAHNQSQDGAPASLVVGASPGFVRRPQPAVTGGQPPAIAESSPAMSTGAKVAAGIGAAAVVGYALDAMDVIDVASWFVPRRK